MSTGMLKSRNLVCFQPSGTKFPADLRVCRTSRRYIPPRSSRTHIRYFWKGVEGVEAPPVGELIMKHPVTPKYRSIVFNDTNSYKTSVAHSWRRNMEYARASNCISKFRFRNSPRCVSWVRLFHVHAIIPKQQNSIWNLINLCSLSDDQLEWACLPKNHNVETLPNIPATSQVLAGNFSSGLDSPGCQYRMAA